MAYAREDYGLELYRRRTGHLAPLDHEAEQALASAWVAGDQRAGERLIEANLRVVFAIAREYRRWGVPLEDLVQQGAIGLFKAAQRYDGSRGNRLRAYAAYWIRAEIRDYVLRSYRMVRLGATRTERRAMRAYRRLPVATAEELAERSGMPLARCAMLWPLLQAPDRSLDASFDGQAPLVDSLRAATETPEEHAVQHERNHRMTARVREALATLPVREQQVLMRRYMSDDASTLEELGRELGVSRERVRQLEERAKSRMRSALQESVVAH